MKAFFTHLKIKHGPHKANTQTVLAQLSTCNDSTSCHKVHHARTDPFWQFGVWSVEVRSRGVPQQFTCGSPCLRGYHRTKHCIVKRLSASKTDVSFFYVLVWKWDPWFVLFLQQSLHYCGQCVVPYVYHKRVCTTCAALMCRPYAAVPKRCACFWKMAMSRAELLTRTTRLLALCWACTLAWRVWQQCVCALAPTGCGLNGRLPNSATLACVWCCCGQWRYCGQHLWCVLSQMTRSHQQTKQTHYLMLFNHKKNKKYVAWFGQIPK
jgi:hypothetical protein